MDTHSLVPGNIRNLICLGKKKSPDHNAIFAHNEFTDLVESLVLRSLVVVYSYSLQSLFSL